MKRHLETDESLAPLKTSRIERDHVPLEIWSLIWEFCGDMRSCVSIRSTCKHCYASDEHWRWLLRDTWVPVQNMSWPVLAAGNFKAITRLGAVPESNPDKWLYFRGVEQLAVTSSLCYKECEVSDKLHDKIVDLTLPIEKLDEVVHFQNLEILKLCVKNGERESADFRDLLKIKSLATLEIYCELDDTEHKSLECLEMKSLKIWGRTYAMYLPRNLQKLWCDPFLKNPIGRINIWTLSRWERGELGVLDNLRYLRISQYTICPEDLRLLPSLEFLDMFDCTVEGDVPWSTLPKLRGIRFNVCTGGIKPCSSHFAEKGSEPHYAISLKHIDNLEYVTLLRTTFDLNYFSHLSGVKNLTIYEPNLYDDDLGHFTKIEHLRIDGSRNLSPKALEYLKNNKKVVFGSRLGRCDLKMALASNTDENIRFLDNGETYSSMPKHVSFWTIEDRGKNQPFNFDAFKVN
jgi:hypothetical protein